MCDSSLVRYSFATFLILKSHPVVLLMRKIPGVWGQSPQFGEKVSSFYPLISVMTYIINRIVHLWRTLRGPRIPKGQ